MATINLENGNYRAVISADGAEIKSLFNIKTGTELIWSGDSRWWSGTAPVLFPIVGGVRDGEYRYRGKTYSLPNHGFARRSVFQAVKTGSDSALFTLKADKDTLKSYPFDFTLEVRFSLELTGLAVQYDVINNSMTGEMLFSIGSHPAFRLPFAGGALENYYVHFSEEEDMPRYFFVDGLYEDRTAPAFSNCRQIYLNEKLFSDGPLIFKGPRSTEFHIKNSRNAWEIIVSTDPLPYLAIWSKPGRAPFLCIEPWYGLPDLTTSDKNFEQKEGLIRLDRQGRFSTTYRIEFREK